MKTIFTNRDEAIKVDDETYDWLSQYTWCLTGRGYAIAWVNVKNVLMHRLVMGEPKGKHIDHINRDVLDNRKSNLRLCTKSQNQHNRGKNKNNTTGYKGVTWNKARNKYVAKIKKNGKTIYLGYYDTAIEAALAYDEAALRLHGEFARTNFGGNYE